MGAQFLDSFDHYDTTRIADKWSAATGGALGVITGSGSNSIEIGGGRSGTNCLKIDQNLPDFSEVYKALPDNQVWVAGFAFKPSTIAVPGPIPFFEIHDTFPNVQLTFAVTATGLISVYRGNTVGGYLGTTSAPVTAGVYDYWEFGVTIDNAIGAVEIRKNGQTVLSLSGVDTQATANATANTFALGRTYEPLGGWAAVTWRYDDIYILDGTGSPNTFLGDTHFQALVSNGVGTSTQWTPIGAANNWDCVNEEPPDDDTTYVKSNTPGQIDTYPVTTPVFAGTVPLVQINLYARKDAGGTRTIQPDIRQGGTDYVVGSPEAMSLVYNYYRTLMALDPVGAPWTTTTINADEFGVKEIS